MQELRLVAVSEDGSYLVLATAGRGTRFTLPVDDRLRAAVRGHFSRLGQFEIEVESPLRPKEIQARIRAGETAEEIAESAGIPVERVRWFEGPVLQEREYMAQQAQRVIARRQGDASPGPPLGEMVEERLSRRGVDLEEVEWDSWKCEDNTWRVRVSFFDDGRPHAAEWAFDPRRRQVSPLNEEAARLSSLVLEEPVTPTVTPLVPRRPSMKIVSDSRSDVAAEQRREYGVERGRIAEPRRQTIAPPRRGYVAPQEHEIVAAAQVPEPPRPEPVAQRDRDTVAQATGGQAAGNIEPPGQAQHGTQTSSASAAEAERHAPDAKTMETLRPIVSETVAEVVAEVVAEAPAPTVGAESPAVPVPETRAVPETETGASETRAEAPEEPAEETSYAPAEQSHAEPVTESGEQVAAVAEPPTDERASARAPTTEPPVGEPPADHWPAGEPVPKTAGKARPESAVRDPDLAPRAAPEPTPEPAPIAKPTPEPEPVELAAAEEEEKKKTEKVEKVSPAPKRKVPVPAPTSPVEPPARPGRRKNSRGKRASVPSWDEIMFGARRPD